MIPFFYTIDFDNTIIENHIHKEDGASTSITKYEYDEHNNLIYWEDKHSISDIDPAWTSFEYQDGLLIKVTGPDNWTVNYEYEYKK